MTNLDDLTKLADLHKSGSLTDDEYQQQKARVLDSAGPQQGSTHRSRRTLVIALTVFLVLALVGGIVAWTLTSKPDETEAFRAASKALKTTSDDLDQCVADDADDLEACFTDTNLPDGVELDPYDTGYRAQFDAGDTVYRYSIDYGDLSVEQTCSPDGKHCTDGTWRHFNTKKN